MSARWDSKPWHPDVTYAPPPTRYRPGTWRLVAGRLLIAIGVIAAWTLLALILTHHA